MFSMMRRTLALLVLVAPAALAIQVSTPAQPSTTDTVVVITRSECPGLCVTASATILSDNRVLRHGEGRRVRFQAGDTVSGVGNDTIGLTRSELLRVRSSLGSLESALGGELTVRPPETCATKRRQELAITVSWRDSYRRQRHVEFWPGCVETPLAVRDFIVSVFEAVRLNRWRPATMTANEDLRVQWIHSDALADRGCEPVMSQSVTLRERAVEVFRKQKGRACLYIGSHTVEGEAVRTFLVLDYVDSRIALAIRDHPASPNGTIPAYRVEKCRLERSAEGHVVIACDYSEFTGQLRW